jgi:hypothetical protein
LAASSPLVIRSCRAFRVAALALAVVRGPLPSGADASIVRHAVSLAHGTPILADDLLDSPVDDATAVCD